jgi:heptosyltransferase-2
MGFHDPPASMLVRATNWLGDAVMTTPALAGLRGAFPGARIALLAKPLVTELFRHHPDVD